VGDGSGVLGRRRWPSWGSAIPGALRFLPSGWSGQGGQVLLRARDQQRSAGGTRPGHANRRFGL